MVNLQINEYGLEMDFFNNGIYLNWITLGLIAIVTIAVTVYKKSA
jgi:hypothetical protein